MAAFALFVLAFVASAAPITTDDGIVIDQSRGADQSVNYAGLVELGPWDDRNYDLTASDLAVIPPKDYYVARVPAFFKVLKRKEMAAEGFPLGRYYPRELDKEFRIRFGGLMQNGVLKRQGLGKYFDPDVSQRPFQYLATDPIPHAVPIEGEGPFDGTASDNETTIEFNPVNPNLVIAGSNGAGGQRHAYSSNGGITWNSAGALPSTCCDPAMDWSPNGAIAYSATLGTGGGCGFSLCTQVFRSTNNGQTWVGPINLSTASSDKEFIHVDKSPTSPFLGRVYVTWHQGNVMQFARSTAETPSLTFAPTQSFAAEERGIGSDITTDFAGRIYYVYPSLTDNSTEIRVLRSTDGGVTFLPSVQAFDLWGDFDFAIPSMETRRAFIYVSVDTDQSNGPRRGRVYITFTDKDPSSPPGNGGTAAQNHSRVFVVYSDDQGATWQNAASPHPIADVATVDRYHPWLDVDDVGNVHVGFYDTRNSVNRTGVDWYYVFSSDGGATWQEETRVSAIVSQNITDGQEWGDYNGLSAGPGSTVAMTWTDNRITPPASTPVQASFAGRVTNIGLGPTYTLNAGAASAAVCAGAPVPQRTVTVSPLNSYANPVALSLPTLNAAVFPSFVFGTNPVTPPGTSTLDLATAPGAPAGTYTVTVRGTGPGPLPGDPVITRDSSFSVVVDAPLSGPAVLSAPADGAVGQALRPTLTWSG
ncbi:MAG TPA: sialidase family protein, partial [Xanthomonadales bacterium]|nr:sialidase family protein [Xanthomonadales bacterium]